VELEFDPELLRQSFLNLLKNAAQAVDPEKGVITISMTRKKSQKSVVVKIRDNGGGIPEHLHRKLFNPFFTTKTRGTGLGLPIARKNVELHNGTITFQSSPETGTTFIVEIPSNP
jgi:signal transduction histidine kinase